MKMKNLKDFSRCSCFYGCRKSFEFKNKLGTLADKPSAKVEKALNELAPYEEWALKPQFLENNPYLMTPGIKYGTKKVISLI